MKLTALWLLVVLLLAPLNSAQDEITYVLDGGKLDLTPVTSGEITNILWKHFNDLVAEWIKGDLLVYYGTFKNRTELNLNTGRLEIGNMMKADAGLYTVEINSKVQDKVYNVMLIKEVPQPSVWIRPVACTAASENCTLACEGNITGAEPVTYSWRAGDGEWELSTKDLNITKTKTSRVKTFSCRMKNPIDMKDSEPKNNPLFVKEEEGGSGIGGQVAGGVIGGGIFILLVVVAVLKREDIKTWVSERTGGTNTNPQTDSKPTTENPSRPSSPAEEDLLNKDGGP